jgi:lipoteichoic acid synthase
MYTGILKEWYRNHYGPDMIEMSKLYQKEFPDRPYIQEEYPFLHHFEARDHLSDHLDIHTEKPNLVILIVEGLANDFLHPVRGIHFMRFTDSLANQGLYWPHFFANSERSFAATPSIMGSLPFGKIGFALLNQYPYHFSLVNIFKENHYFTSFYYGQGAWFHGKEPFYKFNNIDQIIDKNHYHPSLDKVFIGEANHFWGYNDIDLFNQYFITTDSLKKDKRLDIFFTGTSHAPFNLKHPDYYHRKLSDHIQKLASAEDREYFEKYRNYYTALYNVDDALRYFFNRYYVRPEYNNTIFIITGDHPVTEIPVENALKKYHVPLIIYSPTIQCPQVFKEFASHLDLYETLLGFYEKQASFKIPSVSTALGKGLSFSNDPKDDNAIPFMNDNRHVDDYFYKSYFIADNQTLFKVKENLELQEVYDLKTWKKLNRKMQCFRAASLNASAFNHLLPKTYYFEYFNYQLLAEYQKKEIFTMPSEKIDLIQNIKMESLPVFIDFNFLLHDHLEYIPTCFIELLDTNGNRLKEYMYELKSHQDECQFHIEIPNSEYIQSPFFLQLSLGSKEGHRFKISDLEIRIYNKKL